MPTGSNYGWLLNGALPNYANNPGIVSMKKTWETIETWDVGLDWGLFNNRLTGSFDYFVRYTYDMIGPAPELAASLGTGVPKINNADMKSYGFELELGWRDRIRDFSYGVKFVLSDSQQKILKYPNEDYNIGTYYKGQKLNNIWGYKTIGIAQSQEEMDAILRLFKGKYAVLNLIPFNSLEGDDYQRPDGERIVQIVRYLHSRGVLTKVRNSAGQDVEGGCGQLRARAVDVVNTSRLQG